MKPLAPVADVLRRVPIPVLTLRKRRPPPGAAPGALATSEGAPPPEITVVTYTAEAFSEAGIHDDAIDQWLDRDRVTWIDVEGVGDLAVVRKIGETFGIHPLALADVVNVPQRAKFDSYERHHIAIARMVRLDAGRTVWEQVSFVFGERWLVTFQETPGDVFDPIRERLRNGVGAIRKMGSDYLVYSLIDTLIDAYYPVVEDIAQRLEAIDERLAERPQRVSLAEIHRLRRELLQLDRPMRQHREMLAALLRSQDSPVSPEVQLHLRDTLDHAQQILDALDVARELATGLMDLALSSINVRTNEVVKTLTIIASLFIPPTLIASIYGMNFDHMPELHWPLGYGFAVGAMLSSMGAMLWYFGRKGWLGRDGRR